MEKNLFRERIQEDLKIAMKARDKARTTTLRMLITALKNSELETREPLSEDQETGVIGSYAKRCRESIKEFEKAGRDDLVSESRQELEIVMSYLPAQLEPDEIRAEVRKIIEDTGATGPRDMGRVMGAVMGRLKGKADGGSVKNIVSEMLQED